MSRYLVFLATLAFLMWSIDSDKTLSASELIQAYCKLVRNKKVHRDFRLQDLCALHVKIFNDKVRMATISFLWQYRQCRWNLLIFITLVSIFTNIYHFLANISWNFATISRKLLQFQSNFTNICQISWNFAPISRKLLRFKVKLCESWHLFYWFGSNFKKITPISVKFY